MGDNQSKEEIVKQVAGEAEGKKDEEQDSPSPIPKLLSLLKFKDEIDKGNLNNEYLSQNSLESEVDSEPEIIEIEECETGKIEDFETENLETSKSKTPAESARKESKESENISTEHSEIKVETKSLTLLEMLQAGKDSEFDNSTTKSNIAEV